MQGVLLLSTFQQMIKNFNAANEGCMEHDPDPVTGEVYPVLAVKPLDLAAMGEKVLKLDQDRLAARLSYPKHLEAAQAAAGSGNRPRPPALEAITSQFVDDEEPFDSGDLGG